MGNLWEGLFLNKLFMDYKYNPLFDAMKANNKQEKVTVQNYQIPDETINCIEDCSKMVLNTGSGKYYQIDRKGVISDGYHTFDELYEHRNTLFIALCRYISNDAENDPRVKTCIWRSKRNSYGSEMEGWFLLGIGKVSGEQITYHLPTNKWDECSFAEIMIMAPEFDGHKPQDVLERIKKLY